MDVAGLAEDGDVEKGPNSLANGVDVAGLAEYGDGGRAPRPMWHEHTHSRGVASASLNSKKSSSNMALPNEHVRV